MRKFIDSIKSIFRKKDELAVLDQVQLNEQVKEDIINPDLQHEDGKVFYRYEPHVHFVYKTKFNPAEEGLFDRIKEPMYGDMVVFMKDEKNVFAMYMKKPCGWEQI